MPRRNKKIKNMSKKMILDQTINRINNKIKNKIPLSLNETLIVSIKTLFKK